MIKLNRLLVIRLLGIVHDYFLFRELSGSKVKNAEKDIYFKIKKMVIKNDKHNEFFFKR